MNAGTRTRALRAVPPLMLLAATVALAVPANATQPANGGGSSDVNTVVVSTGPGPGDGGPKLAGGGPPPSTDPWPSGSIA